MQIIRRQQHITHRAREHAHCCGIPLYLAPSLFSTHTHTHTHRPPYHTFPHCSLSHFLSTADTFVMRSHTWPRGRSLLCMSGFILEMPGVCFLPENRGDAQFLPAADRGVSEVWGRWDRELHCAAEAWFTHAVGSQAAVLALSLDLLQTSFPRRSAVLTVKQNREERNVQNSTPVLTTERAVDHQDHIYGSWGCRDLMIIWSYSLCSSCLKNSTLIVVRHQSDFHLV